jgi:NADH-quinone oxidoreductase subunit N
MSFTVHDLMLLSPSIIVGYGAIALLAIGAFWRRHGAMTLLALACLAAAFVLTFPALARAPGQVTPLLRVDRLALFYMQIIYLVSFAVVLLAHDYLRHFEEGSERFYSLLLLAVLGMSTLVMSNHFISFAVGLEVLSVSLYGLVGYTVGRWVSLEAGIKYLILGATSIAFLLLGMALVYFETGTMSFDALRMVMEKRPPTVLALIGLGMMLVGFGFKIAAVPFHAWAPDVYQGSPAPSTALLATGSKASVFVLLLRFMGFLGARDHAEVFLAVAVIAVITMFGGNLLALFQRDLKRLIGCSAISHIGYLLIPLLAGSEEAAAAIGFYFAAYFVTIIAAVGIVSALSSGEEDLQDLDDYAGLGYRRPWLAAVLGLSMLSLAGIPPTVGFVAKFYIFAAAAKGGLWFLLVVGLANAGIAVYYYLRVLATLYMRPAGAHASWRQARPATAIVVGAAGLFIVALGIYPTPLISVSREAARQGERPASWSAVAPPEHGAPPGDRLAAGVRQTEHGAERGMSQAKADPRGIDRDR